MKKRTYLILLLAVFIITLVGILVINKKIKITPIFAQKYEVTGIDVSHYQGTIDWMKLAEQNLDFAFIKATEGSSHIDECFYDNWKEAGKTDLYIGAYHFFSFDSDGEKQAQFYIDTVGNLNRKMAPAVDVEFYGDKESNPPPKDEVVRQLSKMLDTLEEHYQIKPVIYTTYQVYHDYIKGEFEEYPLWIRNVYYQPLFSWGNKWTFWQYTDTAVLEGYQGNEKYIDRNVFRGTQEELEALLVQCGEEELLEEEIEEEIPEDISILDEEKMESLLADTYGLFTETDKNVFLDLSVDLAGREKDGEVSLRGTVSGVYKETNKEFEIVYEIDRESGEISAKGYLQALALPPLYQEFLFHNLTVESPLAENLSFFDDEVYLSEQGNFHKWFAVADIDGNGEQEFLFCLKQIDGKEEFIYVLAEEEGKLICRDILHTAPAEDGKENVIRWFDCASFMEIPTENCEDYKSRDEVFSAIEDGDFSVVESKYAAPPGCGDDMEIVEEMEYVLGQDTGRTERCDIDRDGFDELLILIADEFEDDKSIDYERIDFILDYRNGRAVCLYYDWCDGMEWLFLGAAGKLIHCSCSLNGSCTYYGFYECTLNARGIKDIDYTEYGIEVCDVYESGDAGFWWWSGQQPEITQTGIYYTRARAKNAEEINDTGTARGRIKELITKEQFIKEYNELTGEM